MPDPKMIKLSLVTIFFLGLIAFMIFKNHKKKSAQDQAKPLKPKDKVGFIKKSFSIFSKKKHHSLSVKTLKNEYQKKYPLTSQDYQTFWAEQAQKISWEKPFNQILEGSFKEADVDVRWFSDGVLNACYNCVDRHLDHQSEKKALIWVGNERGQRQTFSFLELHAAVCQCANGLRALGVKKSDRVMLYLPMIPEAIFSMLACARIGAIHSVVFAGFSAEALCDRINDAQATFIITANEGLRGGKKIPLKNVVDQALENTTSIERCIVVQHTDSTPDMKTKRDVWYHDAMHQQKTTCKPEPMNAEDPLFILYTSGSTGKPKGMVHTTGGYCVHVTATHEYYFKHNDDDVFWCTADIGWITGHSYMVYGPLCNGQTSVIYEGVPNYPSYSRWWEIVDELKVTHFYTAPTAIRSLMKASIQHLKNSNLDSLKVLGSVGEPINPEAWGWYFNNIGKKNCPIIDTWWQTETGGHMIAGHANNKPGCAGKPFFGINPAVLDDDGAVANTIEASGNLCFSTPWPGQARTVYNDHQRYIETYYRQFPGYYFSGDGCMRDKDGDYWITGRVDDVLNVSGHRLGSADIESAIGDHPAVIEAAVVGFPHDIKGEEVYAFVVLNDNKHDHKVIKDEIKGIVRSKIGPFATPDQIDFRSDLPKTRSGKIMRRILRKIAAGESYQHEDLSTLANPKSLKK
jgi:acetyl-CoA synthetase